MLAAYDPASIQARMTKLWDNAGFFRSQPNPAKPKYSIVIPPPNVTGALHLGHALNGTLQDVMIRWKRMQGFEVLWMPGADHAGIATQAVVEKRLFESEKKTRHDLGRDALVQRIWDWKHEYEARIQSQLRAIGSSCDFSRWRFTFDDICAQAVRKTFFDLFRAGYIYRGKRLVNWDVELQTSVADDEVYHEAIDGNLWHFRYPVEGTDRHLEIATTRPETMLGDTAVAVHPNDDRYRDLIGKHVRLPLVDRLIPIIADGQLVDPTFGTGVVKVTPAHDPNDYACGLRNGLEQINILTPDGKINANGGAYVGLKINAARKKVVEDLEALGLVAKVEPHRHNVGHSDRSKTRIEPFLSDQWFIRMDVLAQKAIDRVKSGEVRFIPGRYADTYLSWLGEKRDWCISRQLWWGHQIPIWSCTGVSEADLQQAFGNRDDVSWRRDEEREAWLVCSMHDLPESVAGQPLVRDPDVLDTWFSSALWPHSTMGWPTKTPELDYFYPTDLLSTAREIITLWVARMVIMSDFNLGQIPFRDVYIHPVIQDGQGRKMSKTLGNGVDPFDIIAKYGADAMRYTLVAMTTETQDVRMPVKKEKLPDGKEINISEKFELGRNFGTKIYNASKFVLGNLEGYTAGSIKKEEMWLEDRWILHRLTATISAATSALENYQYSELTRLLHEFFWSDFCDWYVEMIKPRFRGDRKRTVQRVAAAVLDQVLRLLHPVMPFLTEEIWQALNQIAPTRGLPTPSAPSPVLTIAAWPTADPTLLDPEALTVMAQLQQVIHAIRNIRGQFGLSPKLDLNVIIDADAPLTALLRDQEPLIRLLAKVDVLQVGPGLLRPPRSTATVLPGCKVYVPLAGHVDFVAEIAKQEKKRADLEKRHAAARSKLDNPGFVAKSPPEVVDQHRQLADELTQQIAAVTAVIADLKG